MGFAVTEHASSGPDCFLLHHRLSGFETKNWRNGRFLVFLKNKKSGHLSYNLNKLGEFFFIIIVVVAAKKPPCFVVVVLLTVHWTVL